MTTERTLKLVFPQAHLEVIAALADTLIAALADTLIAALKQGTQLSPAQAPNPQKL